MTDLTFRIGLTILGGGFALWAWIVIDMIRTRR
jgi:hypothetical protein